MIRHGGDAERFPQRQTWRGQSNRTLETADGPTIRALAALAKKHRAYIVSPIDLERDGRRVNTAVMIDREGTVIGASALLHHFYIVTSTYTGDCQAYDITGEHLLDERGEGIHVSRIRLDLDRGIYHQNLNRARPRYASDVEDGRHPFVANWIFHPPPQARCVGDDSTVQDAQ